MSTSPTPAIPPQNMLRQSLGACMGGFRVVSICSFFINFLMLTAPLYMLQVFDRVIAARSTDTLLYLTLIALSAMVALGALEIVRGRTMIKLGTWLDQRLGASLLEGSLVNASTGSRDPSVQGLRDMGTLRNFLTGPSIFPILDAPWTPIFIVVMFLMHPLIGVLALVGAVILLVFAVANDVLSREQLERSGAASITALKQAEAAARNADAVMAMGLMGHLIKRWHRINGDMLSLLASSSYRSGVITAASKVFRMALQIAVLGLGAWLVIGNELTAGGMIAGSILLGRALGPVDQAINSWKAAIGARAAYERIKNVLAVAPMRDGGMALPAPTGALKVENLTYAYPGATEPIIRGLNFQLEPGESVGIIGPTAMGKTTLARLLVGNSRPLGGHVRLDGADVWEWDSEDLGQYIGYLPQDVELFSATIRDNIARLGESDGETVVQAARLAGVHELILRLPGGYETEVGHGGAALSGGQRQRIALARALFGDTRLVVLDEPSASLDQKGESALLGALQGLKKKKVTTVIVAHRPNILRLVDKILVLRPDAAPAFGPRDEILKMVTAPTGDHARVSQSENENADQSAETA